MFITNIHYENYDYNFLLHDITLKRNGYFEGYPYLK